MSQEDLLSILSKLESELHEPAKRRDAIRLDEILHPDFKEFGRSGNAYCKADIIDALPRAKASSIQAQDFSVQPLATNVALLTYRSAERCVDGSIDRHALRSSLWKLGTSGWQIVFHQATPTLPFTKSAPP